MKRIICLALCCLFLVGCAHNKRTIVTMKAKEAKVPLGQGLIPIEGKGIELTIAMHRYVDGAGRE